MSDKKISQLPPVSIPLAGTEVLPIVQDGATKQVSVAEINAGLATYPAAGIAVSTGTAWGAPLSTPIGVTLGGTGTATLAANNVLLGNGTSAVLAVAPGTSGNVLTSNGTTWSSTALPASGTVTSVGGTGAVNGISLSGTVTSSGNLTLGGALTGVNLSTQVTGTLPVANGGAGQTSYTDGQLLIGNSTGNTLAKATLTAGTGIAITNGSGSITIEATGGGSGTVTSVAATVPAFLNITGSPITTSGTLAIDYSGTALPIANGGTSATTANGAVNALLPLQTGNSGKVLGTDGTDTSWVAVSGSGTVTSVAATVPAFLSVSGSPITASGTLAFDYSGTALPIANGGTGATTLAANNVILGNGTSAVQAVAPGSSGNILTSDGTTWVSGAPGSGGTVTSVGGTGTVNGITLTGTVTSSGNLTLGGALSGVDLTTQVTGILPTANGGTGNANGTVAKVATTGFSIEESGGKLVFKYGATTIASMSSAGVFTTLSDVVSNGTP